MMDFTVKPYLIITYNTVHKIITRMVPTYFAIKKTSKILYIYIYLYMYI